ncbi:MAG: flagellar biosynthesis protein FliQ [Solirubrobacteraceae bacterium]|nr:flagellar biosynthesis protein FliQ [Solirubrobacteraceae bacterium]
MGPDQAISIGEKALTITLTLALPLLVVGLVVGVFISIIQAVTQIQEQTLSFVPKLLALAAVLVVGGPWMVDVLTQYTRDLWTSIPQVVNR